MFSKLLRPHHFKLQIKLQSRSGWWTSKQDKRLRSILQTRARQGSHSPSNVGSAARGRWRRGGRGAAGTNASSSRSRSSASPCCSPARCSRRPPRRRLRRRPREVAAGNAGGLGLTTMYWRCSGRAPSAARPATAATPMAAAGTVSLVLYYYLRIVTAGTRLSELIWYNFSADHSLSSGSRFVSLRKSIHSSPFGCFTGCIVYDTALNAWFMTYEFDRLKNDLWVWIFMLMKKNS